MHLLNESTNSWRKGGNLRSTGPLKADLWPKTYFDGVSVANELEDHVVTDLVGPAHEIRTNFVAEGIQAEFVQCTDRA